MGDISKPVPEEAVIIENNDTTTPESLRKQSNNKRSGDANTEEEMDQLIPSTTDTETASAVGRANTLESATPSPPIMPQGAIISRSPLSEQKFATASVARQLFFERNASIDENQELLVDCTTVATTDASGKLDLVIENENAKDETPKHHPMENRRIRHLQNRDECGSPSVSFNIAGKTFFGGREGTAAAATIATSSTTPFERNSRRRSSCMETWSESNKLSESIGLPSSVSSNMISSDASIPGFKNRMFIKQRTKPSKSQQSIDSNPSISSSVVKNEAKKKLLGNSKINGSSTALAVRIVKRTMHRKESSLKRKVTKAQRKERRATKTLGIVVGKYKITVKLEFGIWSRFEKLAQCLLSPKCFNRL
uniref:Uncharacterized protein n=1 Tax=Panagrolaimus sp. ES5 TaxID=591445 RepID=A0AC34F0Z7_9BILA